MWLYQHLTECPFALQMFLNYHPEYWCLIPMKSIDADIDNQLHVLRTTVQLPMNRTIRNLDIYTLIQNIPKPPIGYNFSHRQMKQQFDPILHLTPPTEPFQINATLYNMSIVAVCKSSYIYSLLLSI